MSSRLGKVLCVLLLVACAGGGFANDVLHVAGRLEADLRNGSLSDDEAVLYAAMAIMEPRLLPERYRGRFGDDCGMELLAILARKLPNASPETKEAVRYVMTPHERDRMGRPARLGHGLDSLVSGGWLFEDSVHFRIHYTTTGGDASTQANAKDFLSYLEDAYREYARLGFQMPVAPMDGRIDVILRANPCPVPSLGFECGNGGVSIPPNVADWYGGQWGDPLILLRTSEEGEYRKVLAAHELFHQVQYQTAGFLSVFAWWFILEGQAAAMEDVVHPTLDFYDRHVTLYYATVDISMADRAYDAAIFWKYLIARHSPSFIIDLLNALASVNGLVALNGTVANVGRTPEEVLHDFALWSFFVGSRYRTGYFDADARRWELSTYGGDHELGGDTRKVQSGSKAVRGLGTQYVRVTPHASVETEGRLKVRATGGGEVEGWLIHRKTDGSVDIREMSLQSGEFALEIGNFNLAHTIEVVLAFSNGATSSRPFSYELEMPFVLDLAFSMDTTGSMAGSIEAVRQTAGRTRELLETAGADFRIAITEFKDFPVWPYGWSGDFPYRKDSEFSNDQSVIEGGIAMLQAWGGGDWPESTFSGLMGAIGAVDIGPWRKGVKKAIIVMTDAPPHDPEPFTGHARASVVAAAKAGGAVEGLPRLAGAATHAVAPETPIAIYAVVIGGDFGAYSAMSALAEMTGGKVWVTSYDTANIAGAILEAIGEISGGEEPPPPPSGNRPPDASGAIASPSQLWPPNNKLVPIRIMNVADPDGDAVTIEVTGITQDEPRNGKVDADGVGSATPRVRATRDGSGNGRVYAISFTATDARGDSSSGKVTVCVPHDQGGNTVCTDDGQLY